MKKAIAILSLTGFFSLSGFSQNLDTKKLDIFFDSLENNNQVMGNFAVAKSGKIIYTRSIGYSAISGDEKVKVNNETKFRIGSETKTFTATMSFHSETSSIKRYINDCYPQFIAPIEAVQWCNWETDM